MTTPPECEYLWYREIYQPRHELFRQWCGHRAVTQQERLQAAEAEVRRVVAFTVETNRLITATCIDGPAPPGTAPCRTITPRGHPNLPVITRRRAGITRDDRVLLAADTDTGILWIVPPKVLALILQPHTTGHGHGPLR